MEKNIHETALARYLGLCRRAGGVIRGGDTLLAAIRSPKKPAAILLTADISARSEKQYADKAASYNVPIYKTAWTGVQLAQLLGYTSPAAAIGLINGRGPVAILTAQLAANPDTKSPEYTKQLTNDVTDRKDDGQWQ